MSLRSASLALLLLLATGCGDENSDAGSGGDGGAAGEDAGGSASGGGSSSGGDSGSGASSSTGGGGSGGDTGAPVSTGPGDGSQSIYVGANGTIAVEAENFSAYTNNDKPREWVLQSTTLATNVTPDPDPSHADSASGNAYLEMLPDTRVTHDDELKEGESIYNNRGTGPMLDYQIEFAAAGTYYVWVRAYSTGGEDNGIHVGLNGDFPDSGYRIQFCSGKNQWTWSSALRDSGGQVCGVPLAAQIEVPSAGLHTVSFSAREDGFEFDKFVLSSDSDFVPDGAGPSEATK